LSLWIPEHPRDGKTIDEVGIYHPIAAEGSQVSFNAEKVQSWLSKGATPTDTVRKDSEQQ